MKTQHQKPTDTHLKQRHTPKAHTNSIYKWRHTSFTKDTKKKRERKEKKNKYYSAVNTVYCNIFLEVNKAKERKDNTKEKKGTNEQGQWQHGDNDDCL